MPSNTNADEVSEDTPTLAEPPSSHPPVPAPSFSTLLWLYASIASLFLLSLAYFFLDLSEFNGTAAAPYSSIVVLSTSFVFTATSIVVYRIYSYSPAVDGPDPPNFTPSHLWSLGRKGMIAILSGIFNLIGMMMLATAFYTDSASAGISAAITSGVVVVVAVTCEVVWKEKLNRFQWFGVCLSLVGIIVVGAVPGSPLGVIVFSILAMVSFSISNLAMKYCKILGLPPSMSSVLLAYSQAVPCLLVFFIQCIRGVPFQGMESSSAGGYAFLSGILLSYGLFSMNFALGAGKAGIVAAICRSNGAIVLVLNWVFLNQVPNVSKIMGAILIMLGVAFLSVEKYIVGALTAMVAKRHKQMAPLAVAHIEEELKQIKESQSMIGVQLEQTKN